MSNKITSLSVGAWVLLGVSGFSAWLAWRVRAQMQQNLVKYEVHTRGIILVTGASTGIGNHAVIYLAQKFPDMIVLAGVRKASDESAIVNHSLPNLSPIILDVSIESSCKSALQQIEHICHETKLPFVALVNNAGVARRFPAEFHDLADAKAVFDTNFWGAFTLVQLFLPLLRASKGRIINISSISEFVGNPMNSVYVASKYAMGGYSDALRREIAHFGVSVSVIQPAYVKSAIFETAKKANNAMHQSITAGDNQAQAPPATAAHDSAATTAATTAAVQLYPHFFSTAELQRLDAEIKADASDPLIVSAAIADALVNPFPLTRYPVGRVAGVSAAWCAWIRWALDDRAVDKLITPAAAPPLSSSSSRPVVA
jgi:NAD(P)-dependent dehydrogenase (short-subunit alcohol dehydrogenase family)